MVRIAVDTAAKRKVEVHAVAVDEAVDGTAAAKHAEHVFRRLDQLGVLERVACIRDHRALREASVRTATKVEERRLLRKHRVWIDAGVGVAADSTVCQRVNQLGICPK